MPKLSFWLCIRINEYRYTKTSHFHFSIDKGSVKNDEILKCAHSRHCCYCSFLCLTVVGKCRTIMLYMKANKHRINLM